MSDQPFSDPVMEAEARRQGPGRARRQRQRGPLGRGDRDSSGMNTPAYRREQARVDAQSLRWMLNHGKIKRAQKYLRGRGYDIDIDGLLGPQTKAAARREYRRAGLLRKYDAVVRARRPRRPQRGGGGGGGAPAADPYGGMGGGGYADPDKFGGVPGMDVRGAGTARLLPRSMADTLAGYEFDPQIQELLGQQARGRRDTAQHQRDIGAWYNQVGRAREIAGQRDIEAGQRTRADIERGLQGILQSLGGSRGAGVVGAAGLNDLAAIAAQGSSQERYNADLAPLLEAERAGARERETARASQIAAGLDERLVGLRGQRGQARKKALLEIIAANNQGRQTNFQNRLALQNARMAAASLGINADQAYAGIAAQRAATRQNAQRLKLQSLQFQQQGGGSPNWARLNYPDRQTVVQDAVGRAVGTMAPDHWDDAYVRDRALRIIRAGGYKSARGRNYRGKVNKQSQRQINAAVDSAARAAYRQWRARNPQ